MGIPGIIIVLLAVGGGFTVAGGHMGILVQPSEFIVILGAAVGALLASAPGKMRSRVMHVIKTAIKDTIPKTKDYLDLLKCQYELFMLARRQGVLALEAHVNDPAKSTIFSKYPSLGKQGHARTFLAEAMQQLVNGISPDESRAAPRRGARYDEDGGSSRDRPPEGRSATRSPASASSRPCSASSSTMGHMDAPPAEIGHHVAAALVGTFLGILVCYGILQPLANNAETQEVHALRYLTVIKSAVIASARGVAPPTAVEFGRKMIFSDERPSFADLDKALQSVN